MRARVIHLIDIMYKFYGNAFSLLAQEIDEQTLLYLFRGIPTISQSFPNYSLPLNF